MACQAADDAASGADDASKNPEGYGRVHLGIHDDPLQVEGHTISKVLTTVTEAEIHGHGGWTSIDAPTQELELLELQGGLVDWIGAVNIPVGDYDQIRLRISEARAVVDGTEVELTIPSAYTSGIKIDTDLHVGVNQAVWVQLDFDLDDSIHQTGDGKWMMRPVIKLDELVAEDDVVAIAQVQAGAETSLALPDGASILLEEGALPEGTVVSLERIIDAPGTINPSSVYEVLPSGPLAAQALVTLPYSELPKGMTPQDLAMSVDRALVPADADEQTSRITATLEHFCTLSAVLGRSQLLEYTRVRRPNDAVTVWAALDEPTPWMAASVDLNADYVEVEGHLAEEHEDPAPGGAVAYVPEMLEELVGAVDFATNTIEQEEITANKVTPSRTLKIDGAPVHQEATSVPRVELRFHLDEGNHYRATVERSEHPHAGMLDGKYVHVFGAHTALAWSGDYRDSNGVLRAGEPTGKLGESLPRTLAGTNSTNDRLLLMVIGGDKVGYPGMDMKEAFAHAKVVFGDDFHRGILLDGAKSTSAVLDGQKQYVGTGVAYNTPRPVMVGLSITATCSDAKFQDVDKEIDWFYPHVYALMCTGAIDNAELYHPGQPVKRAEFLKLVIETAFPDVVFVGCADESFNDFDDVPRHAWYARYVEFAQERDMIKGYEDDTFRPDQSITRAEAAEMIVKAGKDEGATEAYRAIYKAYSEEFVGPQNPFTDVPLSHWAFESIHTLRAYDRDGDGDLAPDGIFCGQGEPGQFQPNTDLLRDAMAKIICIASHTCEPESCE